MIVCYSHLRWDFVWQRPQHLMSRFARHTPVIFVEEPEFSVDLDGRDAELRVARHHGVTVLTPLLPQMLMRDSAFNAETNPVIQQLVSEYCRTTGLDRADESVRLRWLYTPMALGAEPAAAVPTITILDVMDELAAFRGAPAAMLENEAAVLAQADLVFTGGPSLYDARKHRHHAVHCFPSGVEGEHFAAATTSGITRPGELAHRQGPILGYCGVIDERLDLELIAALADHRNDWTIAMVGPVAKIAFEDLPQRPNILYFGMQEYTVLPSFLACFDVALLPFAQNEATRFISPTKTLEYLAAGRPVVSTPITDVKRLYHHVVAISDSQADFIRLTEMAIAESSVGAEVRHAQTAAMLADYHWDAIAGRMWSLIDAKLQLARLDQSSFAMQP